MNKFEKYEEYRKFINEGGHTIGEVYKKLHELFDENDKEDVKNLHELGNSNDLYLFYH